MRGLAPSAIARAELDHDLPSARKASTAACCSSIGGASTTTSGARRGVSANPRCVALTSASVRSSTRSRPTSTRNRARCDSSAASLGRHGPAACSWTRLRARLHPVRAQARTVPAASRAKPPCLRLARHCGMRPRRAPPTPAALRPPRAGAGRSSPRAIRRAAGVVRTRDALSTSAVSAGMSAASAACLARASAARAALVRSRRIAIPATTSSWAARDAGGSGVGSSSASARSASSRRPIRSRRRTSRFRACAAFTRSPCVSSVARAASSAFAGQPRSRETSAISASATTHLARATVSLDRKRALHCRNRVFARTRSPSCAIAMPRSARAGASSRSATRFNAPRRSPAASARAAAVISDSIGTPPGLSLLHSVAGT